MKRSSLILVFAGVIGAPLWLLENARQTLGSNVYFGIVVFSIYAGLVGLAAWCFDRE